MAVGAQHSPYREWVVHTMAAAVIKERKVENCPREEHKVKGRAES